MKRRAVYFEKPYTIVVREEPLPEPAANEVLVETIHSAISSGTELLFYRGQVPEGMAVDESIASLRGSIAYPLKYGYTAVGRVRRTGEKVASSWMNRPVFCFQPHQSHFIARPEELLPIPEDLSAQDALFLPNMETAVNFVMDGRPLIGENVVVFGQGIVGLLTTALLSRFPLKSLFTLDRYPRRREKSMQLGAHASYDPGSRLDLDEIKKNLDTEAGADLIYEISGHPDALDSAIALASFATRIVVGSWYGTKRSALDLGSNFHRHRIRIISSQVSTIDPVFSGRWDKKRRMDVVFDMLRHVRPAHLISHHFPVQDAAAAFAMLDKNPTDGIQVVLDY